MLLNLICKHFIESVTSIFIRVTGLVFFLSSFFIFFFVVVVVVVVVSLPGFGSRESLAS
jgi:uncharacterized membrane protein